MMEGAKKSIKEELHDMIAEEINQLSNNNPHTKSHQILRNLMKKLECEELDVRLIFTVVKSLIITINKQHEQIVDYAIRDTRPTMYLNKE